MPSGPAHTKSTPGTACKSSVNIPEIADSILYAIGEQHREGSLKTNGEDLPAASARSFHVVWDDGAAASSVLHEVVVSAERRDAR